MFSRMVALKRIIECGLPRGRAANALNPSQARRGRRAENEREGDQAVKVKLGSKDFAGKKLTLEEDEYRVFKKQRQRCSI